jgi:hypothetical protein
MAELTSLMYSDAIGFGNGSDSLKGRKPKLNPLQLYSLSPQMTYSGGALTWGILSSYQKAWGVATTLIYSAAEPGYSYVWNVNDATFTVTTDTGAPVTYTGINTVKALPISWGVLKSSQFSVVYTNFTSDDIFLIATRVIGSRETAMQIVGLLMNNDFLAENDQHAVFDRLSTYGQNGGEYDGPGTIVIIDDFWGDEAIRTILLSKAEGLQAGNNYPLDLIAGIKNMETERAAQLRQGYLAAEFSFLMIALFAQNLLTANYKVLFEPWMLWSAYQWYFNTVHNTKNARRIFDLSPRWG